MSSTAPKFERVVRDVLIEHIDGGAVPFSAPPHSRRRHAFRVLILAGYLTAEGPDMAPTRTTITDRGRNYLAKLIAAEAHAIAPAMENLVQRAIEITRLAAALAPFLQQWAEIELPTIPRRGWRKGRKRPKKHGLSEG